MDFHSVAVIVWLVGQSCFLPRAQFKIMPTSASGTFQNNSPASQSAVVDCCAYEDITIAPQSSPVWWRSFACLLKAQICVLTPKHLAFKLPKPTSPHKCCTYQLSFLGILAPTKVFIWRHIQSTTIIITMGHMYLEASTWMQWACTIYKEVATALFSLNWHASQAHFALLVNLQS